jgi:membrane peptidoglycan carboxypeptidase
VGLHRVVVPDAWKLFALKEDAKVPSVRPARYVVGVVVLVCAGLAVAVETRSSWFQSHVFSAIGRRLAYPVMPGPTADVPRAAPGPYDIRLGFAPLAGFIERLQRAGYEVSAQANPSATARTLSFLGLPPIYREKLQAGLRIEDRAGAPIFESRYPYLVYPDYRSVPPLVINTLLFIENRQLLDPTYPGRNPAIEWERVGKAAGDFAIHLVDSRHPRAGGSTLATQLEKLRHSPGGRTTSAGEKVRQVAAASMRAYLDGSDTREAQQRIVLDYINTIPLAATPASGEVLGLGDGLNAWYGADFAEVNRLLSAGKTTAETARAYRQVLSLFLALRAPTWYLADHPDLLKKQTDAYLRVLAANGVIPERLRDLALGTQLVPRARSARASSASFVANKAPNAVRNRLLSQLGVHGGYALDRLDLTVRTTFDKAAQDSATALLAVLSNAPSGLLESGNPKSVIYSVTLYERLGESNALRIQTDNYNQPLDINQGTKLQLGSTAKLRTLIHYLEIVTELHRTYASTTPEQLKATPVNRRDALTAWALSYLSTSTDKGLEPMLEAALNRKYAANIDEAFFTAGGLHFFENFDSAEDNEVVTVKDGFHRSFNLVFIRMLRDIERYYTSRVPGVDEDGPARQRYLARFADVEGREFLQRFHEKYRGKTADQALLAAASSTALTPLRTAVIFRSVRPGDGPEKLAAFLAAHLPAAAMVREDPRELYEKYGPDRFNLHDRGYLAHLHPLELWLLNYQESHPAATLSEIYAASADVRQEVYQWLFKSRSKHGQDKRIETMMEVDAFKEIHRAWKRLGYPFQSLVPSYATAIGVSGDTPAALAKLVGILVNDGRLLPTLETPKFHFAQGTPYETIMTTRDAPGEQLLEPAIARLVRREMIGVVENGTGRRARGGLKLPNGMVMPIGGKTGTGDNQFHQYGKGGGLLSSRAVNRTATFAFFVGDRFFGTIVAFVPGKEAASYNFTSALALEVLKGLYPTFTKLAAKPETITAQR